MDIYFVHSIFMQGSGSAAQGEISFLSWNSKVQHILASTSYNGTTGEEEILLLSFIWAVIFVGTLFYLFFLDESMVS